MEADVSADPGTSLSPARVAEMLERGEAEVIDVRPDPEWEAGHARGARHIQIEEITANAETIDKGRPVVFQCRGGSRSEMVAAAFRESGWDAHNLEGGLRAWHERGLPLEPEGGEILEGRGLPGA
ncbi:MAG TPA: rhodanese-like domain-containing protein [Solirubrobacterales bacterium]|nr:rhodanese-like domain-containing protein [Solirubrobacterales bacterium]